MKVMKLDVDVIYNRLIDEDYFTEDELNLLTGINGYSLETLNDACRYRYAGDIEDVLEIADDDEEDGDEEDESLYDAIEQILYDYHIIYGDIVEDENEVRVVGIPTYDLSDAFSAFEDEGYGLPELEDSDIVFKKENY